MDPGGRWRLLQDADLERDLHLSLALALEGVREALRAHADGELQAPPRFSLDAGAGRLVFTVGADPSRSRTMGFRAYETFPERTPEHAQVVAMWDAGDGRFLGLVLGDLLASDAPHQLEAYDGYFLLPEERRRAVPLSHLLAGRHPGRRRPEERTVFLSAGLAGTEPAVARRLLEALA